MPLYEYICSACAGRFEVLRPISQRTTPARCPHCGREEGQLELSRTAFLGSDSGSGTGCSPNTWTGGG